MGQAQAGGPLVSGKLANEFPDLAGPSFVGCSSHVCEAGQTFGHGDARRGVSKAVEARDNVEGRL